MSVRKRERSTPGSTTKIPDKIATSLCCDSFSRRKMALINLISNSGSPKWDSKSSMRHSC